MTLALYHRGCFTADISVTNTDNGEFNLESNISKTYISSDKTFAAMACGNIPTVEQWDEIRGLIEFLKLALKEDTFIELVKQLQTDFETVLRKYTNFPDISHYFIVSGDLFLECIFEKKYGFFINQINPDLDAIHGTGSPAAKVLINSGKEFSQKDFFRIVSMSCKSVSERFTFIELKNVIGTPWHSGSI